VSSFVGEGFDGLPCPPLTVLRLVRVLGRGLWRCARPGVGLGPVLGRSGRCGGRAAGGFEEVQLLALAVPALGQVQGEAARAAHELSSISQRWGVSIKALIKRSRELGLASDVTAQRA
jgi:hypothetical protein